MDFTLTKYRQLLTSFLNNGYSILPFQEYFSATPQPTKVIYLRHDVDELPVNALKMAELENTLNIKATYFFRIVKKSNNPEIIHKISCLGHEIGYHYEDLATSNGSYETAINSFKENLEYFRTFYPVKTVCMHGSSSSKWDNRLLWTKYRLEDFGIIGEPYLSIDFNRVSYITDTGYAWDGGKYAVRDVVKTDLQNHYHSSDDIIKAINNGTYPDKCMILAHTLWTDSTLMWLSLHLREFIRNNIKLLGTKSKLVNRIYSSLVKLYWK